MVAVKISTFYKDGKKYISSKNVAVISNYTTDYIARLCRNGKINGTLIGSVWFVEEKSLLKILSAEEYLKLEKSPFKLLLNWISMLRNR